MKMNMEKSIDALLADYLEGLTSLKEEQQLKAYFASGKVDPRHLEWAPLFGYYEQAAKETFVETVQLPVQKRASRLPRWAKMSAAAIVLVGAIRLAFVLQPLPADELGTYDNPEEAMVATQEALDLLSTEINKGINSISYINQYEQSKEVIFRK